MIELVNWKAIAIFEKILISGEFSEHKMSALRRNDDGCGIKCSHFREKVKIKLFLS